MKKTLTIIGMLICIGITIWCCSGCSKPKPLTAAATAPPLHPPCAEGLTFVSWIPGAPGRPVAYSHGSSSSRTIMIQFPHGLLECKKP